MYSSGGVGRCATALSVELLRCMWSIGGVIIDGKVEVLRETLVLLSFCQLNVLLGLARDLTPTSALRSLLCSYSYCMKVVPEE